MRLLEGFLKNVALLAVLLTAISAKCADQISPEDAYSATLSNRAILVDVREKDEVSETGIADLAVWLPTSTIETRGQAFNDALRTWPKEQKLIFYCRSGRRSEKSADLFSTFGYRTFNAGSIKDWIDAGLPVKAFTPAN
jgi:rhodanese-related sulfurtransferase